MTGAEHYAEAERLLLVAGVPSRDPTMPSYYSDQARAAIWAAHVHATLALAAPGVAQSPPTERTIP